MAMRHSGNAEPGEPRARRGIFGAVPRHRRIAIFLCLFVFVPALAWFLAPFFVDDPLPGLARHTPVRVWRDRAGRVVWYERTCDHEWRFHVPLSQISKDAIDLMLAAEDSRFYSHGGVDYLSCLRAVWQNITHLRTVSGASTISMQVADLAHSGPRRNLWQKFVQAARARKMERLHTKDEILEAYFNHVAYGGKLYGIEAASLYYFGRHASQITRTDATILCGLPQAPNRLRPDLHPERARRRQKMVLRQLVRQGKISRDEAETIYRDGHLAYRDFRERSEFMALGESREWGHCTNTLATIDTELSITIRRLLAKRTSAEVRDAAAIAIDAKTGEIRAYVGTLDFGRPGDGQVDAAMALRSAGSVLKPFIYLEALRGGVIEPDTMLLDAPVRYGPYAPENYDGKYRGDVTARYALAMSLNTPVIRLLQRLGEKRVTGVFDALGLKTGGQIRRNGLSLALGSAGYRLSDIVRAYANMLQSPDDAVWRLSDMLRTFPLPGSNVDAAWKTGTSNNHCDAWCVAYTPEWVVGVWYGNKNGARSQKLVGVELAAPAAGEIMELLYQGENTRWPAFADSKKGNGPAKLQRPEASAQPELQLLSPAPMQYVALWDESGVELELKANRSGLYWFSDGEGIGVDPGKRFYAPGRHRVVAVSPHGPPAVVEFIVSE